MPDATSPNPGAKCGAISTRTHVACKKPAGFGTDHQGYGRCKHHGGSTQSGVIAAEKQRLTIHRQMFGDAEVIDPGQSLLEEVYRGRAFIRFLEGLLVSHGINQDAGIDPGQLLVEITEDGYKARAWVAVWQKEREMHARACKMALDAGIAERQVRMMEQFADAIGDLVYGLIADLGMDPEDPKVRHIARKRLTSMGQLAIAK